MFYQKAANFVENSLKINISYNIHTDLYLLTVMLFYKSYSVKQFIEEKLLFNCFFFNKIK